jgi:hypothetical protein
VTRVVDYSALILQAEVIDVVRQSIDSRIDRCRRLNRSLAESASSLISGLVLQLSVVNSTSPSPSSSSPSSFQRLPSDLPPLDRLQAFADAAGRYLVDTSARKSSIVVPDRSSTVAPLLRTTAEARRHGSELRRLWSRHADAETAVWNALVGDDDDLLRSFYLAVRADITDVTSSPAERSETLAALLRVAGNEDGANIDSGIFLCQDLSVALINYE